MMITMSRQAIDTHRQFSARPITITNITPNTTWKKQKLIIVTKKNMKMLKKVTMSCTHAPKSPRIFGVAVSATYTAKYDFKGVLMKNRINSQNFRRHPSRVRFWSNKFGPNQPIPVAKLDFFCRLPWRPPCLPPCWPPCRLPCWPPCPPPWKSKTIMDDGHFMDVILWIMEVICSDARDTYKNFFLEALAEFKTFEKCGLSPSHLSKPCQPIFFLNYNF